MTIFEIIVNVYLVGVILFTVFAFYMEKKSIEYKIQTDKECKERIGVVVGMTILWFITLPIFIYMFFKYRNDGGE